MSAIAFTMLALDVYLILLRAIRSDVSLTFARMINKIYFCLQQILLNSVDINFNTISKSKYSFKACDVMNMYE